VERFLREASQDPKVRAIKMTLYRTSEESKIVPFLMQAAENGKQVSVVVELKARFDEAANIRWATRLEESGIHVSYGVVGYKTHCKVILVLRQDYSGLRCYCHFGTGNYHSGTARLYTDLGLLTCDEDLGRDATQLFNFLTTGLTPNRHYAKMLMAPANMKSTLLSLIKDEGARAANGQKAKILIKCNALEDPDVVQALYSASRQGAIVEAVIRDSCRLRPGIPGISETIRVRSVIGQFLEHSRIYAFHQGGNERWYIGSADAMMRNLEHRVETLVPVDDPLAKLECQAIMHMMLANEDHCWIMDSCGVFRRRKQQDQPLAPHPHSHWLTVAKERKQAAAKLKKIKSKSKKEFWYGYVAELNPNEPSS
jgi:polyphosphate kinase